MAEQSKASPPRTGEFVAVPKEFLKRLAKTLDAETYSRRAQAELAELRALLVSAPTGKKE